MNLQERIKAFDLLGKYLREDKGLLEIIKEFELKSSNAWFTYENVVFSLEYWGDMLSESKINDWMSSYEIFNDNNISVLVIMAGNIPLVGFHDLLSVLITGNKVIIKMSKDDSILPILLLNKLIQINSKFDKFIDFTDCIDDCHYDSVIATGSSVSAIYFNYKYRLVNRIVRSSRSSIAILSGDEDETEIKALADDIFCYFGLGCRSVSKIFLPIGFDLDLLMKIFLKYQFLNNHEKYMNNYNYYKSIFLLQNDSFFDNGICILKKDKGIFSPVSVVYYDFYHDISSIDQYILNNKDKIQCVLSKKNLSFGTAQKPSLSDYADNIDVIDFLIKI